MSDEQVQHGATGPVGVAPQSPLAEALGRLVAAARAVGLYGEAHPASLARAAAACESLARAATGSQRRFAVINGSLRSESGEVAHDNDLTDLANTLDRAGIAAIELTSPPAPGGVVALASVLWTAMTSPLPAPDLPVQVELAGQGVLRLTAVDYKRLKAVDGTSGAGVHTPVLAELVAATLTGKDIPDDDAMIQELARKVEDAGPAAGLRAEDLSNAIRSAEGTDSSKVRKRVGKFVSALSPGVRAELLAIDPHQHDASIRALGDLALVLPVEEVLGALNRVDASSRRLCNESAMLFGKLAGLAAHDHTLADTIRDSAATWREGGGGDESLKTALDDLMRLATAPGFNPADYEAMLARLAVGFTERVATPAQVAAFEAREVQRHLAIIAGEATQLSTGVGKAGMSFLLDTMDSLIELGDLGALDEAVRSALSTEHGARILSALAEPTRVDRIASAAARLPSAVAAACGLLEHAGPRGSAAALLHLADVGDTIARRRTAELVRRHRDNPGALDEHLVGNEPGTLASLTALAALLPPEMLLAMAMPRLEVVPAGARDAAICAIGARHGSWPREMVVAGLSSHSPAVAGQAIEQVAGMGSAAGHDILRAYIDGAYGAPHPTAIERAAGVMAASGEAGLRCAADLLTKLAFVPSQRAAAGAGAIARALAPFKDDKAVGRALRAMSLSPTRWLSGGEARNRGAAA